MRFVLALMALSVSATFAMAKAPALPDVSAARAKKAPVIDGSLGDAVWKQARSVDIALRMDGKGKVAKPAKAMVAYDDNALYIAFSSPVANPKIAKELLPTQLWGEYTVEVFLKPCKKSTQYMHFAVNSANGRYAAKGQFSQWNNPWQSATKVGDKAWTAEIKIPFASLASPEQMDKDWRINLTSGLSTWAPTFSTYHQPDKFGFLKGLNVDLNRYRCMLEVNTSDMVVGKSKLIVQYQNLDKKTHTYGFKVVTKDLSGQAKPHVATFASYPMQYWWTTAQHCEVPLEANKRYQIAVSMFNPVTKRPFAYKILEIEGPSELQSRWDRTFYMREAEATLKLEIGLEKFKNQELGWKLIKQADKSVVRTGKVKFNADRKGNVVFALKDLPNGIYNAQLLIPDKKGQRVVAIQQPLKKLSYKPGSVQCTDDGRILRDGKLFFPFGVYYMQPHFEKDRKLQDEFVNAGFNSHNLEWRGVDSFISELKIQGPKGIHPFIGIQNSREIYSIPFKGPENIPLWEKSVRPMIKRVAAEAGEHFFGWLTWDEAPLGIWYDVSVMLAKVAREEDPYHPVIQLSNNPSIFKPLGKIADIFAVDPYPMFPGGRIRMVADWMDIAYQSVPHKPIMAVLQTFFEESGKMPTPREVRAMTYLSLVHGAKAIYFFSFDFRSEILKTKHPKVWVEIKKLADEFRTLGPEMLFSIVDKKIKVKAPGLKAVLDAKLFEDQKYYYLVGVNTERKTLKDIAIHVTGLPAGKSTAKLEVMFEKRTSAINGGVIKDTFEPHDVHIYRWAK